MPLIQTGSNIKAQFTEPTTNADGSPLTDLAKVEVVADWGAGEQLVGSVDASAPTGGGAGEVDFTVPVVEGSQMTVSAKAFAIDLLGNKSLPSATQTLTIDLLAPAPPVL